MPRRDNIHEVVKIALINDKWDITDDPLSVDIDEGEWSFEIDLGAEKIIGAEKEGIKIAVEIKTFSNSILNGFHAALGQYLTYRDALKEANINRLLFLAISQATYSQLMKVKFIKRRLEQYHINLIVVNIASQRIVVWKR